MLDSLFEKFERIVVLDTETTGINCRSDEIIELAVLQLTQEGGTLRREEMDEFIRLSPGRRLPAVITNLTGITEQMLDDDGLEKQVKAGTQQDDKRDRLLRLIEFADSRPELDPTGELAELSMVDNAKFIELFEAMQPKYKWRKNSNIYKLYIASKEGKVKEIKPEVFFEDANLTAFVEGDRAYIRFIMKPARQLMVALKSRGWWWNSGKRAWSTYLDRLDKEWVSGISTQYAKYI